MRDSTPDHYSSEMQPPPPPTADQEMSSDLPAPVTLSGPSTSMIAMPVPSAPEVLPPRLREMQPPPLPTVEQRERLRELVELIAKEKRWTPDKHDIALLLMYKDDPELVDVPRRPEADKYLAHGPCVFFVDRNMPADGKKRKSEASPQAGGSSNDEMWIKGTSTSAAAGSLDKKLPPNAPPYSAVFRKSGGFTPEAKAQYGPRSIGHYCLGYIDTVEGHANFDRNCVDDRARTLKVGRNKEKFQPCTTWLVHCMPTVHDSDDAKTSGAPDKPDTTSGSPMAAGSVAPLDHPGDLRVGGSATIASDLTVGGALVSGRGDHAEYLRKYDEEEELNGGDVVALVGDDYGVQKASCSARGSTAVEWMVVTTEPQMLGNAPEPGQERLWVPLVFSGQVSVLPQYFLPSYY